MSNFEKVGKFMKTFGQEVKNKANFPEEKIVTLRNDLISEELDELIIFINDNPTLLEQMSMMWSKILWRCTDIYVIKFI